VIEEGTAVGVTLRDQIASVVRDFPGLTDREITDQLRGKGAIQQPINLTCRQMEAVRLLVRRRRGDGLIGNYPPESSVNALPAQLENLPDVRDFRADAPSKSTPSEVMSEDDVKRLLAHWLEERGWKVKVAWGFVRGIDIDAERDGKRWIIEAKGGGSRPEMRVNYFIAMLGETLQRMSDPAAKYSIALPDMPQFRGLWNRLPELAKKRTDISVLFVDPVGGIIEK
jgi:hypothetical protein